jgi:hypothetical protein
LCDDGYTFSFYFQLGDSLYSPIPS